MSYYSWKKRPPREFQGKPQWTLDEVYISPFTARRRYDEEGVMHYDAVERNTAPTGVEVADAHGAADGTEAEGRRRAVQAVRKPRRTVIFRKSGKYFRNSRNGGLGICS